MLYSSFYLLRYPMLAFSAPPQTSVPVVFRMHQSQMVSLSNSRIAKDLQCRSLQILTFPSLFITADFMDQKCGNIIYQLGVLILELVTGQSSDGTGAELIKWIQGTNFARSMNKMIDPDLGNSFEYKEMRNLLSVAKLCIKSKEKPRFSIPQIFRYLQSKVDVTSY